MHAAVTATIPHSRPALGEREAAAVGAVVASGHIAQGDRVEEFEAAMATAFGLSAAGAGARAHAVALSSGTAALLTALRALDVGSGDQVLIPGYACTSLHQAVRYAGATPRHVDCDPATLNPDPDDARRKLSANTAACIVPHLFGRPADIEAFCELGPPVIEDCAQALGVRRGGQLVGTKGAITVCSFYATKLIAGGEGGMVLSRHTELAARARAQRDCEAANAAAAAFNFKMSDLHAALACVQLRRLDEFLERRARLASDYRTALDGLEQVTLPPPAAAGEHAWFRFVVAIAGGSLESLLERCEQRGIACRRPVGRLVPDLDLERLPGCRTAWARSCSLPLYPALSDDEATAVPRRFLAAVRDDE